MTKAEIEEFIQKQDAIAQKNYMAYQETGIQRYAREREKAEDLAQIARQALSAADDHAALGALRAEVSLICGRAQLLLHFPGDPEQLLRDILALGQTYGLCRDLWEGEDGKTDH